MHTLIVHRPIRCVHGLLCCFALHRDVTNFGPNTVPRAVPKPLLSFIPNSVPNPFPRRRPACSFPAPTPSGQEIQEGNGRLDGKRRLEDGRGGRVEVSL